MRIALVSQAYPPHTARGGIGSQTYLKAQGMAARGHEVHVVAHEGNGGRGSYRDGPVHVMRIAGFEERLAYQTEPVRWLTYSAEVAAALAQLHARAPLDLVDFPEWGCEGYVYLLNRGESDSVAAVVHLHGPLVMFAHALGWPELDSIFYRVGRHMEEMCLHLADAVFSSSRCSAQWCADHYGVELEKIPVLHVGIDTQLFRPHDVPKADRPTIAFVGHIARNKGIAVLVDACCRLAAKYPTLQLEIIGTGQDDLIQSLIQRAEAAGFPRLLSLRGFVSREEIPVLLSRAHVFAAPSLYEGGPGFVYLEASACGLPVVGCSGSGATEGIRPGETGLLVPPSDVEALTAALDSLLIDPAAASTMGQRGRQFVLQHADSRMCLDRLDEFYREVVTRAGCRT